MEGMVGAGRRERRNTNGAGEDVLEGGVLT